MPATSAEAIQRKHRNFQLERRVAADAKLCTRPVIQKQLKEKDVTIMALQRQLDAKQRDCTRNMTKAHEQGKFAQEPAAIIEALKTRLREADKEKNS